jgi:NADH:ubiquinone reductase (non-electrogenic)
LPAGGASAVIELGDPQQPKLSWAGFTSWLAWRSAYLTRLGTLKHRLYVAGDWALTLLFGRDISRW